MSAEEEVCRDGELCSLSLVVSEGSVSGCVSELPGGGGGGGRAERIVGTEKEC